jgi:hypothetical protein
MAEERPGGAANGEPKVKVTDRRRFTAEGEALGEHEAAAPPSAGAESPEAADGFRTRNASRGRLTRLATTTPTMISGPALVPPERVSSTASTAPARGSLSTDVTAAPMPTATAGVRESPAAARPSG